MADYSQVVEALAGARRAFSRNRAKARGNASALTQLHDRMASLENSLRGTAEGRPPTVAGDPAALLELAQALGVRLSSRPINSDEELEQVSDQITAIEKLADTPATPPLAAEIRELVQRVAGLDVDDPTRTDLLNQIASKLSEGLSSFDVTFQKILGYERQADNAKQNADVAAKNIIAQKDTAASAVEELTNAIAKKNELFSEFEKKRDILDALTERANQEGLAKSFHTRKKELADTLNGWRWLFVIGTILLSIVGLCEINFGNYSLTSDNGWSIAARLLIASPLVWLIWFAARQFGHTVRLMEDYAFKEAAAMAFHGYKAEMGEDLEMLNLLRRAAIQAFGDNPVRILVNQPDHSSPLSEVVEKFKPEKIWELLSKLIETF